jgi:hypothetical protein
MLGIPFGVIMGLFFIFQYGIRPGILGGIGSGILFGLAMSVFARVQENKARSSPPVLTDENLLREGPANHFSERSGGAVGRLYLTNKRLFFEAFPSSKKIHEVSIPVHQISEAVSAKSYGILQNQLQVALSDGRTERFVTDNVTTWIKEILAVRQDYLDEPRTEEMRLFL